VKARDIMTAAPACCGPEDSVSRAAQLMEEYDCGCIPVTEDDRVVGVITDRDIAVRGVARARADAPVRDLMTAAPCCCGEESDVRDVERVMSDRQIRRVIITDDGGCCIGIVAQADLARAAERNRDISDGELGRVVERISAPSRDNRL
jgi:CBS domain-containing protein